MHSSSITFIINKNNYMMRKTFIAPIAAIALAAVVTVSSCTKEEYRLDDISDEIMFNTAVSAPIANLDVTLADFFDLQSMKGKFKVNQDQADQIKDAWDGKRPDFLIKGGDDKETIDLSILTKKDFERLKTLNISIDKFNAPKSTDFIQIDDLGDIFGEKNPVSELNDFTLYLDIDNQTPFIFTLKLQFANGVKNFYMPLDGCAATTKDGSDELMVKANYKDEYTVTFSNDIAKKLKEANGLVVSYGLSVDANDIDKFFDINADSRFSMKLKTFIDATVDLSKIN